MQALGGVSSSLGKFCPTPGEFDHHFLPRGWELDKKFARVAGIRSLKKIFPEVARGGCTQLELTETLGQQYEFSDQQASQYFSRLNWSRDEFCQSLYENPGLKPVLSVSMAIIISSIMSLNQG